MCSLCHDSVHKTGSKNGFIIRCDKVYGKEIKQAYNQSVLMSEDSKRTTTIKDLSSRINDKSNKIERKNKNETKIIIKYLEMINNLNFNVDINIYLTHQGFIKLKFKVLNKLLRKP